MKLSEALDGIGRSVSYYPGIRKLCGSVSATVLFCQLFYWKGKESSKDGWVYKDSSELENETGLSYKEQVSARKKLIENGLIEEKYDRLAHKMYFRIMVNSLNDRWGVPETTDGKFGKRPMVSSSIHKITTENTTEISDFSEKIAPIPEQELSYELEEGSGVGAIPKKTPRAFLNSRRVEAGKEPMQTPRTENKAFDALRWKDYFRDQGYEQHKMQFFLVNSKTREATVTKLMVDAKKAVPDLDFKGLIDWWFENGWGGYEPELCFMGKTIEQFLNRDKGKKSNQQVVITV